MCSKGKPESILESRRGSAAFSSGSIRSVRLFLSANSTCDSRVSGANAETEMTVRTNLQAEETHYNLLTSAEV